MFFEHRKTLHVPVLFPVFGLLALFGHQALALPHSLTLAVFMFSGGLHSIVDIFGGGKEMRPWERTDNRAVYNHVKGEWITARRWY